ncbi:MAG: phosphoribosylamine--glycine ligase [Myxococcales bacterium]|nr:phosphoribosylamine--glycine ligase [Myxococcales bacterium]
MKVMVVGSGGREHALAARIASSKRVTEVLCAPGNGGTAGIATNLAVDPLDVQAIVAAARAREIDLVVVGPEAPLVAGLVDALTDVGVVAFGPGAEAAKLEGSKALSKRFMHRHGIPTAPFAVFDDADEAQAYARDRGGPLVVKADGLAAGKGVVVAKGPEEAIEAIDRIMRNRAFGAAGQRVVLESCLVGQEVSYHVVLDGERFVPLAAAQDHKRVGDGDTGPNTGGMGAYSPPPVVTPDVERRIVEQVVQPTVRGLISDGIEFRGVLFIGLMIVDGDPHVIEYNVRFGDPEAQVLMARYGGDVVDLFEGAARGDLSAVKPSWLAPAAMCVVMAAPGYPGSYPKGHPIVGVEHAEASEGVTVQHAGTRLSDDQLLTAGGRVLGVTGVGASVQEAAKRAYAGVEMISFEGAQFRRDIGHHALRPS